MDNNEDTRWKLAWAVVDSMTKEELEQDYVERLCDEFRFGCDDIFQEAWAKHFGDNDNNT